MIYIVHGENLAKSRTLISTLQKKAGTNNVTNVTLSDITTAQLLEMLSAVDIFSTPPFVVLELGNAHYTKFEAFAKELKNAPAKSDLIILSDKELSKSNAFIKAAPELKAQILLNPLQINSNVFKFVDTVFNKNRDQGYKELNLLLNDGEDPFYIFSMILYGARNVAAAVYDSPSLARMAPFAKSKATSHAQNFSAVQIKTLFKELYDLDKDVKTGNLATELLIPITIEKILSKNNV
ncbi:MAG TPA: hypothetical protein VLI92_04250 [Candidatus Saccharimonadales bacterium]|nr:hypothetical protein [Candidatus Saccharimonadales bacterium]